MIGMAADVTRRECIVREREADGTLVVTKISTNDNLADIFTKALARNPFTKLRKLVMNILAQGVRCCRGDLTVPGPYGHAQVEISDPHPPPRQPKHVVGGAPRAAGFSLS